MLVTYCKKLHNSVYYYCYRLENLRVTSGGFMQFGKLLKDYIKKQNLTIYQLAKDSGIDRSFLQGVLNGTRKLPQKRFSDIVNTTFFTVNQVHALCEEYFLERFGYEKIKRFECIERGVTGKIKEELKRSYIPAKTDLKKETTFYTGKKNIADLVYSVLNKDEIENFVSNFNFIHSDINRIVYEACQKKKIKNFFHHINLDKVPSIDNIEAIYNSLYYAQIDFPTYYCENSFANSILPYYIVADDYIITYDEDAENAIVFNTKEISLFLRDKAEGIKKVCRPMTIITENALDYMTAVGTITAKSASNIMEGYDNQICPTFITPEIIHEIATPAVKNIPSVIQRLIAYYDMILAKEGNSAPINRLVVSYSAFERFAQTGIIDAFPATLANPVPVKMRSHFFRTLIDKKNLNKLIVTNPNMIKQDCNLNYQINNNYFVIAVSKEDGSPDDYNGRITYYTDDDVITKDFLDFLDYICMSEKTYSEEVSQKIVNAFIQRLESE